MKKIELGLEVINQIINEYQNGLSIPKLSVKYNVNTRKISNTLKDNGVIIRNRRKFFYNENFFKRIIHNK